MSTTLDNATKLVTLASLLIALFTAWKALPLNDQLDDLKVKTQQLDMQLKQAEAELRENESVRKLGFDLYLEVKAVLAKESRGAREEDVLQALVESVGEDPLRQRLLSVLAVAAQDKKVQESATNSARFYEQQAEVAPITPAQVAESLKVADQGTSTGHTRVDIFYCEQTQNRSKPLADKFRSTQTAKDTGEWRLRLLPASVNKQPGYRLSANEIRFNAPDEQAVAQVLSKRAEAQGAPMQFREATTPTPGYVSVFFCA